MPRSRLEALEAAGYDPHSAELLVALVWLVLSELPISETELNASRRRAMFVLAAGGDPHRELDQALHTALSRLDAAGLPAVSEGLAGLLEEPELAWRCLGLALLADELADE